MPRGLAKSFPCLNFGDFPHRVLWLPPPFPPFSNSQRVLWLQNLWITHSPGTARVEMCWGRAAALG